MIETSLRLAAGKDATAPPEERGLERDEVRLLVTDRWTRSHVPMPFREIGAALRPGDALVVNDSTTLPAAFTAKRNNGGDVLVHASTAIAGDLWTVEPRETSATPGEVLRLPNGGRLTLLAPLDPKRPRLWYALFDTGGPVREFLKAHGRAIRYSYVQSAFDIARYQTIFARSDGSAEMPSAARPFSARVVGALRNQGVEIYTITLHCGVASMDAGERPQAEWFSVDAQTAGALNAVRDRGGRIIAVGTTVVRTLESAAQAGRIVAARGWTEHIVTPENPPVAVDGLLSGFHQPQASHVDLLRGFLDDELLAQAYAEAAARDYLWHEFGDVHLIL